jgi:hypothetical protein
MGGKIEPERVVAATDELDSAATIQSRSCSTAGSANRMSAALSSQIFYDSTSQLF